MRSRPDSRRLTYGTWSGASFPNGSRCFLRSLSARFMPWAFFPAPRAPRPAPALLASRALPAQRRRARRESRRERALDGQRTHHGLAVQGPTVPTARPRGSHGQIVFIWGAASHLCQIPQGAPIPLCTARTPPWSARPFRHPKNEICVLKHPARPRWGAPPPPTALRTSGPAAEGPLPPAARCKRRRHRVVSRRGTKDTRPRPRAPARPCKSSQAKPPKTSSPGIRPEPDLRAGQAARSLRSSSRFRIHGKATSIDTALHHLRVQTRACNSSPRLEASFQLIHQSLLSR